ncbi:MAG TPA: hypothetical protein VI997_10015 [Candidatus Thermoplasmatota archaeon]|nr:hypothetical protein [Candidatus Thermoplasmatota archaeon]
MLQSVAWAAAGAAVVAASFALVLLARFASTSRASEGAWALGLALYAFAAAAESEAAVSGWSALLYRAYFPAAALLVACLGVGTVALLGRASTTRVAVAVAALLGAVAAVGPWTIPLDDAALAGGSDLGADAVPFPHPSRIAFLVLNVAGGLALVGGAAVSWWRAGGWAARLPPAPADARRGAGRHGLLFIALGALLPFAGGALSTLQVAEGRVLLQLAGVSVMFVGYLVGRPRAWRAAVLSRQEA